MIGNVCLVAQHHNDGGERINSLQRSVEFQIYQATVPATEGETHQEQDNYKSDKQTDNPHLQLKD